MKYDGGLAMQHLIHLICRKRLKTSICILFALLALIPLVTIVISTYRSDRRQIIANRDQLARLDLTHVTQELDSEIESYEDILYQLYTDSELAEKIRQLNSGDASAVARNQIRRDLRSVFWLRDDITSITVITKNNEQVFYDRLSTSLQTNPCIHNFDLTDDELFAALSATKGYTIYPVRFATHFANSDYYLFYIGHKGLNEKAITQTDAVFLMSVDVDLIRTALKASSFSDEEFYSFIIDQSGYVVFHPDLSCIGEFAGTSTSDLQSYITHSTVIDGKNLVYYTQNSVQTGWTVVSVLDCAPFTAAIDQRLLISLSIAALSFLIAFAFVVMITSHLTQSVEHTCDTITELTAGNFNARVDLQQEMSPEIRTIATGLNRLADKLNVLIQSEKDSAEKVKNAEIAALEAQLNPHFLYNSLDTINWMAIEQEQYPISNVVSALGKILRYGIDNSNGIVTIADEQNWLNQYLFLHQNRLRNMLQCDVQIEEDTLGLHIHKLLLQPFVENAIIHGFTQDQELCRLHIHIFRVDELLQIEISDNGRGIPREVLENLSTERDAIQKNKRYHGMQNAINRLRLYYGERAWIHVESGPETGTHITIRIPPEKEG